MSDRPLIFLTNDDGVDSPGLRAAAEASLGLGEIMVAAPRAQRSAAGRSLTGIGSEVQEAIWSTSLGGDPQEIPVFALDSSPAQVVRFALRVLAKRTPSLAISGINYGENLGTAITVSGTVGAALEAAAFGVPAMAVSLEMEKDHQAALSPDVDFSVAKAFIRRFAQIILERGPLPGVDILKIDVPKDARPDTPWRLTRLSRQRYIHPAADGRDYEVQVDLNHLEPDSDVYALLVDKVVSVTPLTLDLTAKVDFATLASSLSI